MAIHNTLRQAREQSGLTLEQAAECIGISGASFSRMENGLSKVTTDRLEMLAELYQVSASALIEGSIVTRPSTVDLERMRAVVETVQAVVNRLRVRPSPEKMGMAVAELYRLEIDHIVSDPKSAFDPKRHVGIIETMFVR
ncbi:helix-turn-helix domain-containing protein [Yoonia litorea]|uniref:Transcriptional regulator, contains XRE-family HTH domain n=1 Tax=Yoonia litorea TaxID=1123755 RepID=A0A1I6MWP3_9RHOB|nr:helix-turn-helix transcriptional regulator [Yoonia litorea]SFS20057.1 Transcriptional regulator, contains XRE-family HTH domain [Yoonia litorea]